MHQCGEMFGQERGEQICSLIQEATGKECPCKSGQPCPIAGGDGGGKLPMIDLRRVS